jgi:hypothetical protein
LTLSHGLFAEFPLLGSPWGSCLGAYRNATLLKLVLSFATNPPFFISYPTFEYQVHRLSTLVLPLDANAPYHPRTQLRPVECCSFSTTCLGFHGLLVTRHMCLCTCVLSYFLRAKPSPASFAVSLAIRPRPSRRCAPSPLDGLGSYHLSSKYCLNCAPPFSNVSLNLWGLYDSGCRSPGVCVLKGHYGRTSYSQ